MSLPPNQQLIGPDKWPIVGEKTPRASDEDWLLSIDGSCQNRVRIPVDELRTRPQGEWRVDIHCVTRWSKLDVVVRGILLESLLRDAVPANDARFVSFVSRSERAHSTSMRLADALKLGAIVAFTVDGNELSAEHGGPIRMIVPGRYFYKSVKWLERIELLAEDRLGYWEATAGYHNEADPWKEQRFVASSIGKHQAAKLIAARDFSNLELLGIAASGLDLRDLRATNAKLRHADLRRCDLRDAVFDGANLSGAFLGLADLRGASFKGADLEGTDFSGADLRDCDLTGASLFGATFHDGDIELGPVSARCDRSTIVSASQIEMLSPHQAVFVRSHVFSNEGKPR